MSQLKRFKIVAYVLGMVVAALLVISVTGWHSWYSTKQELADYQGRSTKVSGAQKTSRGAAKTSSSSSTSKSPAEETLSREKLVNKTLTDNASKFVRILTEFQSSSKERNEALSEVATSSLLEQMEPYSSTKSWKVDWKDLTVMLEPKQDNSGTRSASVTVDYTLSTDGNKKEYQNVILLDFEDGLVSNYKYFNIAQF